MGIRLWSGGQPKRGAPVGCAPLRRPLIPIHKPF